VAARVVAATERRAPFLKTAAHLHDLRARLIKSRRRYESVTEPSSTAGDALAKATKNNSHGLRQGLEALQRVLARTELHSSGINLMIEQSIADTIEPLCFTRRMRELASSSAANEGSGAPAAASPLEPAALGSGPWSYQELVERHREAWRRFRVAMWRLCDACMPTDGSNGRPSPGPVLQALREAPTVAKLPARLGGEALGCVRELLWFHLRRDPNILSEVFAKQACGPA
jgi:hypothetical protein